jgi:hypothetical protein
MPAQAQDAAQTLGVKPAVGCAWIWENAADFAYPLK